jgi:hypothetical protein
MTDYKGCVHNVHDACDECLGRRLRKAPCPVCGVTGSSQCRSVADEKAPPTPLSEGRRKVTEGDLRALVASRRRERLVRRLAPVMARAVGERVSERHAWPAAIAGATVETAERIIQLLDEAYARDLADGKEGA